MSEVSKVSGAAQTGAVNAPKSNNTTAKTEKKPVELIKKNEQSKQLDEPQKPERKVKTYTIREGQLLGFIAQEQDTTVDEIVKLNPGLNPDKIKPGQQIKIGYYDPKEYATYQKKLDAYEDQQRQIRETKALVERTNLANKQIEKANKNGWSTDYSFKVDEKGYVIVTLKEPKKLHEIRKELGLPSGHLDVMNNLESKFGKIPTVNNGTRDVETWDNVNAKEGQTFLIDPACFRTERTWTQAFKDFFSF